MKCQKCGNDPLDESLGDGCDSCRLNRWALIIYAGVLALLLWWLL